MTYCDCYFLHRFVQSWRVKNNGEEVWPYGCYVKCTSNENLPTTPVSPVEPGQHTVISVQLRSPLELGSFQTKWRLYTSNGSCFGGKTFLSNICSHSYSSLNILFDYPTDTMWSIVQVTETGTLALTQQLSELRTNNMSDVPTAPKPIFEVHFVCNEFNVRFSINFSLSSPIGSANANRW